MGVAFGAVVIVLALLCVTAEQQQDCCCHEMAMADEEAFWLHRSVGRVAVGGGEVG